MVHCQCLVASLLLALTSLSSTLLAAEAVPVPVSRVALPTKAAGASSRGLDEVISGRGLIKKRSEVKWPKEDKSQFQRGCSFWMRISHIYFTYKLCQLKSFVTRRSKEESEAAMNRLHEKNSDRFVDMCLTLRGFYIKTGQFLGTRYDFMPLVYCTKLATLSDSVPPMPEEVCRQIIEEEFEGEIEDHFTELNLSEVLGAASIAQVHKGVWRATGDPVAVKLQYPNAEIKMRKDLTNIRALAEFLQRTDLKFDVLSAIKELQSQIQYEFDFKREAANMDFAHKGLSKLKDVVIPKSVIAKERVLVMSFVEGENLSKLQEMKAGQNIPLSMRQSRGSKLFKKLALVYGTMFFKLSKMHADPNPGNISLKGANKVGLLDWGQCKDVTASLKRKMSNLVLALNARDKELIVESLFALGVRVAHPEDLDTVEAIAVTMLDTREMEGFPCDPFDERCASTANPITLMPPEIYFVVRSVQMLRGLSSAFQLSDFSLAETWAPLAIEFADREIVARTSKEG